jgi:ABC-type uncharacterized transport system substrate-binding protein
MKPVFSIVVLLAALLFAASPAVLLSHPHVFNDTRVTVRFSGEGIEGFGITWLFDAMFSSMIIGDFDTDEDGSFSPAEIEAVRKGAFSNLKNFHYFTYIRVEGTDLPFDSVREFRASIQGNRLVYAFFIPVGIPVSGSTRHITVAAYDESYYCDVTFPEHEPLGVQNGGGYELSYRIVRNEENPMYFGQVLPCEIRLAVSRK